jgi:hypothetical protein
MFLDYFCGKVKTNYPFFIFLFLVKFYQLFKMLKQKNSKILKMLERARFVKSSFLHFGNTKTEVEYLFAKTLLI